MTDKKNTDDLVSMFMNFGKDMKLPSPDLEAIVERHKKNLQALDTAAKTAGSGASEIMARQRAMVQEALEEISAMAETVKGGGGPQSLMTAQAEFARRSFEAAIKNTSEIAGIAQKSSTEAFKVLQQNMQETLEEARRAMTQTKK
ncbi:phasin family protein [Hoeflea alexandrii]|jgi:phasin family protein|uniref:TIGR01841 family phasin n=1 Tax=Hoeflea alexandrii TaxID=288436 RepID=A0ABT1CN71_9HYPH|nr:TIGR01841 family phasin [Hoeflea alexandrii]MBV6649748.1 TIGR01841 family phasin [Hoeflea sp.]MCO6407636.1 TIGR01841 family phasin [Hoeflea alexandrii]